MINQTILHIEIFWRDTITEVMKRGTNIFFENDLVGLVFL